MGFARDELDYRAEELALEKERIEERISDQARLCAQSLMICVENARAEGVMIGGAHPDDILGTLDLMGCEMPEWWKSEVAARREKAQRAMLMAHNALSPAGQA